MSTFVSWAIEPLKAPAFVFIDFDCTRYTCGHAYCVYRTIGCCSLLLRAAVQALSSCHISRLRLRRPRGLALLCQEYTAAAATSDQKATTTSDILPAPAIHSLSGTERRRRKSGDLRCSWRKRRKSERCLRKCFSGRGEEVVHADVVVRCVHAGSRLLIS